MLTVTYYETEVILFVLFFRNGPGCPDVCPQRYLGPWAKRSIKNRNLKRSFHRNSDLQGIS